MGFYFSIFAAGKNSNRSVPMGLWNVTGRSESSNLSAPICNSIGGHGGVTGAAEAAANNASILDRSWLTTSSCWSGRYCQKSCKHFKRVLSEASGVTLDKTVSIFAVVRARWPQDAGDISGARRVGSEAVICAELF